MNNQTIHKRITKFIKGGRIDARAAVRDFAPELIEKLLIYALKPGNKDDTDVTVAQLQCFKLLLDMAEVDKLKNKMEPPKLDKIVSLEDQRAMREQEQKTAAEG